MVTINQEIQITGMCLMDGKESTVRIVPSTQKGIRFYPNNSADVVIACPNNVISTQNCTILGCNNTNIRLVEHFMAACAFAGIDSLDVFVSTLELPILDGSSRGWLDLFDKAGFSANSPVNKIIIETPISYTTDKISIVMLPAGSFKISYCIDLNHPDLRNKWFCWQLADDDNQIKEARTFGFVKDLEKFQKAGLALGANIDNIVGLTDAGYTVSLRSELEPVKHKILDIIGDINLYINPLRLNAHIIAINAGHTSHVEFTKVLKSYMESRNDN
jgi:UDP-3-O-[3-hydroxymyristoyl] N-acetylglucosamine deacetylase